MAMTSRIRDNRGQMTVELMVALPVILMVAVIAVNAILFFSECASFDRAVRQAVRVYATSPGSGGNIQESRDDIERFLNEEQRLDNAKISVAVSGAQGGFVKFSARLEIAPTLFGMGLVDHVFGVPLPRLTHQTEFIVDCYKPGIWF